MWILGMPYRWQVDTSLSVNRCRDYLRHWFAEWDNKRLTVHTNRAIASYNNLRSIVLRICSHIRILAVFATPIAGLTTKPDF
jgi:hypothetical protein